MPPQAVRASMTRGRWPPSPHNALGCRSEEIVVASTGVIGVHLPMDRVRFGVPAAVKALSPQGGAEAALAIMTTDTRPKEVVPRVRARRRSCARGRHGQGRGHDRAQHGHHARVLHHGRRHRPTAPPRGPRLGRWREPQPDHRRRRHIHQRHGGDPRERRLRCSHHRLPTARRSMPSARRSPRPPHASPR